MTFVMKPLVSLRLGKANEVNSRLLGSGVCIGEDLIMTARHVVGEHQAEMLFAGLIPESGSGVRCQEIHFHSHPDQGVYQRDVAIIRLSRPHNKPVLPCNVDFDGCVGGKFFIQAINTAEEVPTELLEKSIKNWTDPGGWEFDTWPAAGMSGGAAIVDGKLVGIIQAQDRTQNSGIIIPLSAVREFLEQHLTVQPLSPPAQTAAAWQALDTEFMDSVRKGVEQNLTLSPLFLEKLGERFGQVDTKLLAGELIVQCGPQKKFSSVVQKMQGAFKEAWAGLNTASATERNNLLEAANSVVSHLVLYNVKDDWLAANHARYNASKQYVLPKLRLASANVALSRLLGAVPSYKRGGAGQQVANTAVKGVGTALEFLESGIGKEKAVRSVLELLTAALKPSEIGCLPSEQGELEELAEEINEMLEYYRTHEELNMRRRHFIMLSKGIQLDEAVYSELQRLLPDLAWVTVDLDGSKDVFVISDVKLKTAIEAFFNTLEGVNPA